VKGQRTSSGEASWMTKKFSFSGPSVLASGQCDAGALTSRAPGGPTANVPIADSAVRVRKFSCLGESLSESRGPSPLGLPIVDADVEATLLHAPKTIAC
jgi:hypothetical protein